MAPSLFNKLLSAFLFFAPTFVFGIFHDDSIFEPEEHPYSEPHEFENACSPSRSGFGAGAVVTPVLSAADKLRAIRHTNNTSFHGQFPVVGGNAHDGTDENIAMARYRYDGGLDTSFFTTGIMTNDPTTSEDTIHALSASNSVNNAHMFAGRASSNEVNWMVGRFFSDGRLDTTFWTSGRRIASFSTETEIFRALTFASNANSEVHAAGYVWHTGRYNFAIAAFNSDGSFDTSFNTDGYDINFMSANDSGAFDIEEHEISGTTDSIIIAGPVYNGIDWDFGVARYMLSNGSLDTAFATDGSTTIAVGSSDDKVYSITERTGNNQLMFFGGYAVNGGNNDFAVVKLKTNGTLDTTFHTDGKAIDAISASDDVVLSVGYDNATDKIYAVGTANNGGNIDVAIIRYLSSGGLDTSFHTDGKQTYDVAGGNDAGVSFMEMDYTQWFYVGARVTIGATLDFGLLRIHSNGALAAAGEPSESFGTIGRLVTDISATDAAKTVVYASRTPALSQDQFYSMGSSNNDISMAVYNLERGELDTSFNTTGTKAWDLGTTGEVINGGFIDDGNNPPIYFVGNDSLNFIVGRMQDGGNGNGPTGSLDTSFHTDGWDTIDFSGTDVGYAISSRLYVAGKDGSGTSNFAVAKYLSSGTLDTSFHTDGKQTYSPTGAAATARASVVITTAPLIAGEDTSNFVAISLISNGDLNTSFHTDGINTFDVSGSETMGGVAMDTTGYPTKAVFVGGNGTDFCIARIRSNGVLDTAFNTSGTTTIDFGAGSEIARAAVWDTVTSKLIVGGDDGTSFLFARLNPDGTLDTTFNSDGKQSVDVNGAETMGGLIVTEVGDICASGSSNGNADFGTICLTQ